MASFERILVTGGAGFVGSHMSAALAKAYPQAALLILARPGETGVPAHASRIEADLVDEAAMDRLVAQHKPDLVVHLAGQSSIGEASKAAEQTWRVNFHGAFGLGAAIARHAPRALVLFSSSATVYGLSYRDGVLDETAPVRPLEAYGRSKVAAEFALGDVLGEESRLIIARPVNHSGPGQRSSHFVLASFASQIAAIEAGVAPPKLQVGELSRARDFLDVRDVVDAYMRLIAAADAWPDRVSVFNVASGQAYTIAAILEEFRRRARVGFDVEVDPARLRPSSIDIPSIACDASKLRQATGWRPRYPLGDLVQALLDECRAAHADGRA